MKNIAMALVFLSITNIHAASITDKQIHIRQSQDDLRDVFVAILQQTGIPILYEGSPQKTTLIDIPKKDGSVKEVLDALAGTKYTWTVQDGVLLFQNKEFINEPYYPVEKYRFNYQIDTDDLENFLKKTTFLHELWKERIATWGPFFSYKHKKPFKKSYETASLRNIILDLLKDSHSLGIIYKYQPADSAAAYKLIEKNKNMDYNQIKDAGKPFYVWAVRSYEMRPIPKEYNPENILDGRKMLDCSLSFSYSAQEGAQLEVHLKNISSKTLNFKDFKKDGLVIFDQASQDDTHQQGIGCFLIYPPLSSKIPENLELLPSQDKTFKFPLKGSRYAPFNNEILTIGCEKRYNYKPDSTKELTVPHNYSYLRLVVYFYDSTGNKCKSVNKDFVDTAEAGK